MVFNITHIKRMTKEWYSLSQRLNDLEITEYWVYPNFLAKCEIMSAWNVYVRNDETGEMEHQVVCLEKFWPPIHMNYKEFYGLEKQKEGDTSN